MWDGQEVVLEQGAATTAYLRGLNLIASIGSATSYYLYNAHGDVVQLTDTAGAVTKEYKYDAFGVEQNPSAGDVNPFRYCGEQYDRETGSIYLRARYYDVQNGGFTTEDTHWNPGNMLYGDSPVKWNEQKQEDPLGLNTYTYVPDNTAIRQSGNLYGYVMNNPVRFVDSNGYMAVEAAIAATNFWNPAGWVAGGMLLIEVVVAGVLIGLSVRQTNDRAVQNAYNMMAFASTAAPPPPPDDPNSKGTQITSKTLYNKDGIHVDVENPGGRPGQIHLQKGGAKYFYNVQDQTFRIGSSIGRLAPNSIQDLLKIGAIAKTISKGLTYLGY